MNQNSKIAIHKDTFRHFVRVGFTALIIFAVGLGIAFQDVVLSGFAYALVLREQPEPSDVIVVMLGGHRLDRILKASQVYRMSLAPRVVVGSGYIKRPSTPFWKRMLTPSGEEPWVPAGRWYQRELIKKGVPQRRIDVIPTPDIFDSAGELTELLSYFEKKNISSAIFVTSATHSRRLRIILNRLAPNFRSSVLGSENPRLINWWTDQNTRRQVFHEYGAIVKEWIRSVYYFLV